MFMKNLKLPNEDQIYLLIGGIGSVNLFAETAAAVKVEDLLKEMCRVTSAFVRSFSKRSPVMKSTFSKRKDSAH